MSDETKARVKKSEEEWRHCLTPEQYRVLRRHGTEQAFTGQYHDSKEAGTYRCAGCGGELHGAVLGKGQQLRPGASGLRNPARQLVAIGAERAQRLRRVLRSADPDLCHHKARIQNCMGFPLSAGWSMSFHVNRAMRPSTLA